MATFLFESIVFGPVFSRRLGQSLGLNILPVNSKFCNFNCIYCECGLTNYEKQNSFTLPSRNEIYNELESSLKKLIESKTKIDTITYAGNGEPTIHPEFSNIVNDTVKLRNTYLPSAKIAVLTNATTVNQDKIRSALQKVDLSILKLDSVFEETIQILNCPRGKFDLNKTLETFKTFGEKLIIQSLFVKGEFNNIYVDNTTDKEIDAWTHTIKKLKPSLVMIYTIERDTPYSGLRKINPEKLEEIAAGIHKSGIKTQVSY